MSTSTSDSSDVMMMAGAILLLEAVLFIVFRFFPTFSYVSKMINVDSNKASVTKHYANTDRHSRSQCRPHPVSCFRILLEQHRTGKMRRERTLQPAERSELYILACGVSRQSRRVDGRVDSFAGSRSRSVQTGFLSKINAGLSVLSCLLTLYTAVMSFEILRFQPKPLGP